MKIQNKKLVKWLIEPVIVIIVAIFAYYFACGIGLEKVYSDKGISIYMPDEKNSEEARSLATYVSSKISGIDKDFQPNVSVYFCNSLTEFHFKILSVNTPLASNRVPLKTIFFRPCNLSTMIIEPRVPILKERNIRDVMLHEVVHNYEWQKLGVVGFYWKSFREKWKMEGFPEYVVSASSFPIDRGLSIFIGEDSYDFVTGNEVEPEYFYFVSRLRTDYLLRHKSIGEDEYWSTRYDEDKLDEEIRQALGNGNYHFDVK